jgi:hypothetical protein
VYNKVNFVDQLFALKNGIDPSSLDVLLQLHPAWVAEREGSQNIHGLTAKMSGRPSADGSFTYASAEWCSMPLDEGCGVQRFKRV